MKQASYTGGAGRTGKWLYPEGHQGVSHGEASDGVYEVSNDLAVKLIDAGKAVRA